MGNLIEGRGLVMLSQKALLRSFGSRHIQREPSGFWEYVRDDTHLVGQETGAITPWATMSSRMYSLSALGTVMVLSFRCSGLEEWKGQS